MWHSHCVYNGPAMHCSYKPSFTLVSFGALLIAGACTFEPPGSVLNENGGGGTGADAGGVDDEADGGAPGAAESLSVTFTTAPRGGQYAPANIVATWIEDAAGTFVATIDRQSLVRTSSLRAWNAVAGADTDAVTGATRLDHAAPITILWDISALETPLVDGAYNIRIETAETNANTPADNAQATFPIEINGTPAITNPTADSYLNVTVDYSGRAAL